MTSTPQEDIVKFAIDQHRAGNTVTLLFSSLRFELTEIEFVSSQQDVVRARTVQGDRIMLVTDTVIGAIAGDDRDVPPVGFRG